MDRPIVYVSPEDKTLVSRNQRTDEISRRLQERTKAAIDNDELGEIVEDPLGMLIEDARTKS
jgi:hypothetical protein